MQSRNKIQTRLEKANQLIQTIASTGRQFFNHPKKHGIGRLELNDRNRLFFIDGYTGKKIYLHYKHWKRGFSEGGTLRELIKDLKDYVLKGKKLYTFYFGPYPEWINGGDAWGYGDDMQIVRGKAFELGITNLTPKNNDV